MCTTTQTNWTQSVFKKTFVLLPATSFKLWCPVATLEGLLVSEGYFWPRACTCAPLVLGFGQSKSQNGQRQEVLV